MYMHMYMYGKLTDFCCSELGRPEGEMGKESSSSRSSIAIVCLALNGIHLL